MSGSMPLTRAAALDAWQAFLPKVGPYARLRNQLVPGLGNVSRLSAALRYRVIAEDEILRDTLGQYEFSVAEKWLQEVCWRRYWKGWLEMRPDVWRSWRRRVRELRQTLPEGTLRRVEAVAMGRGGVGCMDAIAQELVATGYLHNHARMWWASYWVHVERLPWELGADWFFRHLLDADPASNTLSWRWVAGLQTVGKTYLVRQSNVERYAPELVAEHPEGLSRLADGAVQPFVAAEVANTSRQPLPDYPVAVASTRGRMGLWLHADDLLPELGALANLRPVAVAAFSSLARYRDDYGLSEQRIMALGGVLRDGLARAGLHYGRPTFLDESADPAAALAEWATAEGLEEVVAFAPTVGPVADLLPRLRELLHAQGVQLVLVRRPSDAHAFSMAGAGFFPFWEKMGRHLRSNSTTLS